MLKLKKRTKAEIVYWGWVFVVCAMILVLVATVST